MANILSTFLFSILIQIVWSESEVKEEFTKHTPRDWSKRLVPITLWLLILIFAIGLTYQFIQYRRAHLNLIWARAPDPSKKKKKKSKKKGKNNPKLQLNSKKSTHSPVKSKHKSVSPPRLTAK